MHQANWPCRYAYVRRQSASLSREPADAHNQELRPARLFLRLSSRHRPRVARRASARGWPPDGQRQWSVSNTVKGAGFGTTWRRLLSLQGQAEWLRGSSRGCRAAGGQRCPSEEAGLVSTFPLKTALSPCCCRKLLALAQHLAHRRAHPRKPARRHDAAAGAVHARGVCGLVGPHRAADKRRLGEQRFKHRVCATVADKSGRLRVLPRRSKEAKSATLEAARLSPRGRGGAPSGRASLWECRAARSRQRRAEEAQGAS